MLVVMAQFSINSSLYESKAVRRFPDGIGNWRYCESVSVEHCHGSEVAVGVAIGRRSSSKFVAMPAGELAVDAAPAIFLVRIFSE